MKVPRSAPGYLPGMYSTHFRDPAPTPVPDRYAFGAFCLDPQACMLVRDGRPVELRPCALRLLTCLVERAGQVVRRDELFDRVWPEVVVSDGVLTQSIWEVRRALGEAGRASSLIRTVRGSGYRFAAEVRREPRARAAAAMVPGPLPSAREEAARTRLPSLIAVYDDLITLAERLHLTLLEQRTELARGAH